MSIKAGIMGRPLHLSLIDGHLDIAKLLVKRGADVIHDNDDGETPIDVASKEG